MTADEEIEKFIVVEVGPTDAVGNIGIVDAGFRGHIDKRGARRGERDRDTGEKDRDRLASSRGTVRGPTPHGLRPPRRGRMRKGSARTRAWGGVSPLYS